MDSIPLGVLLSALIVLLLLSGFFSATETSMMAVNRYRLKTLARAGHRGARLAEWLLARTDKLLGTVLLGNNLVNAAAASLLTLIAFRLFGQNELALSIATVTVTFLILVFSEVTPKVIGATYPDRIAPVVSYLLVPLLRLLNPLVWFINLFVQGLLRLLRLRPQEDMRNSMGVEELRTLLSESGNFLPHGHRSILLNLFDLEKLTVDDVMVPRHQMEAVDIKAPAEELFQRLITSHHSRLPGFDGEMNEIVGIIQVRRVLALSREEATDPDQMRKNMREPYFIPSGTPLFTQLGHFRGNRQSLGLVVDEYGELLGLVTVEDILKEIVGEFADTGILPGQEWHRPQEDGSYLVEGSVGLRELNRKLGFDFPVDGVRTLNGLILEHLEAMPESGVTLKIAEVPVEIVQVQGRVVKTVRLYPRKMGLAARSVL